MRSRRIAVRARRTAVKATLAALTTAVLLASTSPAAVADTVEAPVAAAEPSPEPPASEAPEPTPETDQPAEEPTGDSVSEPDLPAPSPDAEPEPAAEATDPDTPKKAGSASEPGPSAQAARASDDAQPRGRAPQGIKAAAASVAAGDLPIPGAWSGGPSSRPPYGSVRVASGSEGAIPAPPSGGNWFHFEATPAGADQFKGLVNISTSVDLVAGAQYRITWDEFTTGAPDGANTLTFANGSGRMTAEPVGSWTRRSGLAVQSSSTASLTFHWDGEASGTVPEAGLANISIVRASPTITGPATVEVTAGREQTVQLPVADSNGCRVAPGTASWASASLSVDGTTCALRLAPVLRDTGDSAVTVQAQQFGGQVGAEHNILVHVVPPPVHHIVITPANSTIVAGDTQAYTAQSYDEDDQLLGDVTATTTFTGSGQVTCTENVCGSDTAGDETITATRGALTAAAQLTIVAGDARRLQVTPGSATVVAGETRSFTARTYDLHDNLVADVTDSTTFTADGAASCSDNRCGSNSVGSYTVTGTHAGMDDTAVLTVSAAAVHTLLIAPELMTVQAGGSQEYAAHVYDRFDNYVSEVTGATQFTGTGATTCSANVCSSETAGNVTITGTWSGLEATAQLTVVPAAPARIALTPGTTTVPAGDVQTYSVEAFDAYDNLIEEVSPSSALAGSGAATCDADRCGSTTAGDYTITATWNGLTDTATLTVTAAEAHRLDITPDTSTITAGDSLTYTARTFDRFDNLVADVTTDTVFTPSTDDVTCTAATCGSEKAGTYSITGTLHDLDLADVAELTVTAASLHHLRVTPETATVTAGETHDFTAHSYDQYDNLIANVTNDTVFTPDTDDVTCTAATCGSEKAGNYTITGTHLDVTDSASLTVTAAEPQRLEITPENVSIAAGETHDFTADAYDQYDNHVADVTNDTTFTPDSDDVTCTAATCGSEKAGNYTISAVYDEDLGASILARLVAPRAVAATASLQVVAGPLDHLDLTPPRASISTDQRQTYQLDGYDSYGNTHGDLTDAAAFTIDGRGTCDGAACGSAVAGRYDVVATIDDLSATAELEVTSDDAGTPVGPPATDPPSVTALPATGTDMQWWQFPAGLLFAGAGLAMLWLNRRQRFAQ